MTYNTKQKIRIIAFFRSNPDKSFTSDEIIAQLSDSGVAKSTVYRIISSLSEEGLLRKTQDGGNGKSSYLLMDCEGCRHHLHLKCLECGRLVHLEGGVSLELERTLKELQNFELDENTMLYGRCGGCRSGEA